MHRDPPRQRHRLLHLRCRSSLFLAPLYSPVVVCHQPGTRGRIIRKSRNQVKVQMGSPFTEGNRINPITTGDLLHEPAGIAHGPTPIEKEAMNRHWPEASKATKLTDPVPSLCKDTPNSRRRP